MRSEILLEKLSYITWDVIENAFNNHILFGEDVITSHNLLTLKNENLSRFLLEDTRVDESKKGCDFEFWIGSNKSGWQRYAIQAKKLTVSNERYNSLSHKVKGIPQIDILENYARANRAIPLYCLYNHSPSSIITLLHSCPILTNIKELGCSITPSSTVRLSLATRGARTFNWFHNRPETLPWTCLVRCPNLSKHWNSKVLGVSMKDMIYKKLPQSLELLLNNETDNQSLIELDIFSNDVIQKPKWVGVISTDN